LDALIYTPRICGICSVSQSIACANALADAQGLYPPVNAQLVTNIILACENMADHLTHFYLFFMPDFARDCYQHKSWHKEVKNRFRAQTGSATVSMLKARAEFMHITGILAGKWPHSLSIQPGGTTTSASSSDKAQLLAILTSFREFLQRQLFGDSLEAISQLETHDMLKSWALKHPQSDFAQFLKISEDLELENLGKIKVNLMSYGAYHFDQQAFLPQGIWSNNNLLTLDTSLIKEDISHSWMLSQNMTRHPFKGETQPDPQQADGYSWCKAPRYNEQVIEVGALARQAVSAHPLAIDLVSQSESNVRNRVIARLLELAQILPEMESWVRQINPDKPFIQNAAIRKAAEGQGLVEAARGSLGHWLQIQDGKIVNYQIIAPTTWNFSPRDKDDIAGALEQALLGTVIDETGKDSAAIQHIVRSFDPCMVCTVH
jgi:hydrogenase large subunit